MRSIVPLWGMLSFENVPVLVVIISCPFSQIFIFWGSQTFASLASPDGGPLCACHGMVHSGG